MKTRSPLRLSMLLGAASLVASCSDAEKPSLDSGRDAEVPGTTLDSGEDDGDDASLSRDAGSDAGDASPEPGDAETDAAAGPDAEAELDASSDAEAEPDGSSDAGDAAGDKDDIDGDGFSNLFELACATDPADAVSKPDPDTLLGEGTSQEPFVLCLPNHFDLLAGHPDMATAHASITWDLDFDQRVPPLPLGTVLAPFTGRLSGHGHTLSNLDFAAATKVQVGLVEALGAGGVLEELVIEAEHGAAGALVVGSNSGTVRRVTVTADTTANDHVGILVNVNLAAGSIEDCHSHGSISAIKSFVGGLVGENLGHVVDSSSTAQVRGENRAGGLVGTNGGIVERSFATGAISGSKTFIGGLVGTVRNGGRVSDCYALGNVTAGTGNGGGLVGSGESVASIERSYAKNVVTAPTPRGVLGIDDGNSVVTDCYFANALTTSDALATGLDDTELTEQESYVGFDFTAVTGVWTMAPQIQPTPSLVAP